MGASETPEQDFDNFFASSEERQNEIYEPIIDWVFDNQDWKYPMHIFHPQQFQQYRGRVLPVK